MDYYELLLYFFYIKINLYSLIETYRERYTVIQTQNEYK